ncbi:Maff2 family protein [Flavonifractor plautii]|nr:Maff2 family protein [Flavonifractor plautii]MDB7901145.1 Maff2 family protein [Flavonifractor plautii]
MNFRRYYMDFFKSAIEVLQTLVIALGAGLGVWGVINLLEGYGNDNPGANAHVR